MTTKAMKDPSSSSSSSSSSNDDDMSSSSNSASEGEQSSATSSDEENSVNEAVIKSLDDLPSDDSCSGLDDSSDDDDDDNNDELTLGETIERHRQFGTGQTRPKSSSRKDSLKIAAERLARYKKSKTGNDQNQKSDGKKMIYPPKEKASSRKKTSKHAPREASSKRSDYFKNRHKVVDLGNAGLAEDAIVTKKYKARDPRMVSLSGYADQERFDDDYKFLEEMEDKEMERLKASIAARKLTGKKGCRARRKMGIEKSDLQQEKDQEALRQIVNRRSIRTKGKKERDLKRQINKRVHENVAKGQQQPYYYKKSEYKRFKLENEFEELEAKGDVDRVVEMTRKRNAQREHIRFGL